MGKKWVWGLMTVAALAGCTNVNKPLNPTNVALENRIHNSTTAETFVAGAPLDAIDKQCIGEQEISESPTTLPHLVDNDGFFFGIAISGGGSRSANFSAACLFQLQRLGLLQHCDYISSVSGGSLTAAYYCLNDQDWNPQTVQQKMTHSFAGDVIGQTIIPWNFLTLMWTDWDRSDLLADSLQKTLFTHDGKPQTFADLRSDRPRLLLNATDLQSGRPFVFTNESFDTINSDLSQYPIAHAVAASAAFPVVMHHVTLRDYSTIFKQYRHLIDGGVTDNLGVETLVETYDAQVQSAARRGQPNPYPHGAVLVVIDARTKFDAKLSDKGDISFIESIKAGTGLTSTALLARASSATLAEIIVQYSPDDVTAHELRQQIDDLNAVGWLRLKDRSGNPVRVVHLSLSRVNELSNLPFESFSESVNNIATYFAIDPTEAYNLYQAADLLVKEKFEPQLLEIKGELAEGR